MKPIALIVSLFLVSCVTPKGFVPSGQRLDFKQYHVAQVFTTDEVQSPYSKQAIPMFEGLLRGKLQSLGFALSDEQPDLRVHIKIKTFDPGNRAVRMIVGFGAGKAQLTFVGIFQDTSGKVLAEMSGGKYYTAMELSDNPMFYSDEQIQMGLITQSVSQVGRFIETNGKLD